MSCPDGRCPPRRAEALPGESSAIVFRPILGRKETVVQCSPSAWSHVTEPLYISPPHIPQQGCMQSLLGGPGNRLRKWSMVVEAMSTWCPTSSSKLSSVRSPDVSTHIEVCQWEDKVICWLNFAPSTWLFWGEWSVLQSCLLLDVRNWYWPKDKGTHLSLSNVYIVTFPATHIISLMKRENRVRRGQSPLFVLT